MPKIYSLFPDFSSRKCSLLCLGIEHEEPNDMFVRARAVPQKKWEIACFLINFAPT
ncbi:MAG: hypothetical protein ACI87C_001008 [Paraperlucidibaca sp.]|jgi:hypothetical protein